MLELLQIASTMLAAWAMAGFPCCCRPPAIVCTNCPDGDAPRLFQLELEGIGDGTCGQCEQINGTYIVDFEFPGLCFFFDGSGGVNPGDNDGVVCTWLYEADPPIACNHTCVFVRIDRLSPGVYLVAALVMRDVDDFISLERTIDTSQPGQEDFTCHLNGLELTDCTSLYVSDSCACTPQAKATVSVVT
jgi:hypothetical protein